MNWLKNRLKLVEINRVSWFTDLTYRIVIKKSENHRIFKSWNRGIVESQELKLRKWSDMYNTVKTMNYKYINICKGINICKAVMANQSIESLWIGMFPVIWKHFKTIKS